MRGPNLQLLRAFVATCLALFVFAADHVALAQNTNCRQLTNNLRSLDNNRDFRNLQNYTDQARQLSGQLQQMESQFVRGGCQRALNAGQNLTRECRQVGRAILSGRDDYAALNARIETGQAVAQQRELTLQQIARFGCNSGNSRARVNQQTRQRSPLGNLLERLFGNEGDIVDDGYNDGYGYNYGSTLRTVCVRKCDGYYWPVSFSTVSDYLGQDEAQCQSSCPGQEVELYYYSNPGEDSESMVNLNGEAYRSLPTAFAYRQEFKSECSCQRQINYGSIVIDNEESGAPSRAVIQFADLTFPLPQRDPRRRLETTVAEVIRVPLPKPRPARPGEPQPERQVAAPNLAGESTYIEVDGKKIRIVGPVTPAVQLMAEGT